MKMFDEINIHDQNLKKTFPKINQQETDAIFSEIVFSKTTIKIFHNKKTNFFSIRFFSVHGICFSGYSIYCFGYIFNKKKTHTRKKNTTFTSTKILKRNLGDPFFENLKWEQQQQQLKCMEILVAKDLFVRIQHLDVHILNR